VISATAATDKVRMICMIFLITFPLHYLTPIISKILTSITWSASCEITRRKDEITWGDLKRTFPASPLTYSLRRDDSDFVVFCFAYPEDADAFCNRFGGERLLVAKR
jgi:hypothetical protein